MVPLQSKHQSREDADNQDHGEADRPLFMECADNPASQAFRVNDGTERAFSKQRKIAES